MGYQVLLILQDMSLLMSLKITSYNVPHATHMKKDFSMDFKHSKSIWIKMKTNKKWISNN